MSDPPVTITPYYYHGDNDQEAAGAPQPAGPWAGAQQDEEFLNWETSGLFTVPTVTNPLTMHIYVSSFIDTAETVQLQINKLIDSDKTTIFQAAVAVPGLGAVEIALDVGVFDLRGETIEVVFRSPDPQQIFQLMPSVEIVEFFPADGTTLPLLLIPPENFLQVFPGTDGECAAGASGGGGNAQQPPPPIMLTTGIYDVPQGVFAVRPQVTVILSSFSDETLTADVVVNRLVRGTTRKETVLTRSVEVPPGEERQFTVEDVEGLPIEVNFTLSRDEQGNALLPSVHVTRLFTADNTVESVLLFPSGGLMPVFVDTTVPEAASHEEIIDIFSTGGFVVPDIPEPLIMHLYFSNPAFVDGSVAFRVNQLTGAEKQRIVSGNVVVPAGGAAVIEMDLSALGLVGKKIEVVLRRPLLPETQIQPSASVITVGDDGATRPVIFLPTGDFASAREEQIPSAQGVPAFPNPVTWGIFDVPVSPPSAETTVNINFSNVSDQPETTLVRVNALVEGTTTKRQLLRQFVTVPANEAEVVTLEGLDGLAIEVIIELPFAQPPAPILPLLTPSVEVIRATDTDTREPLLYLAPGEIRFL